MAPVACNDAELAAILAPPVMEGLKIVGEQFLEPRIEQDINMRTGRDSFYASRQGGSLYRAWTTKDAVGGECSLVTITS